MSTERRARQVMREQVEELSERTQKIRRALNRIRAFLPHPVWGIMVATLIAFSGRGELYLRSVGMVLVALWLILDLWAWLLEKSPRWCWMIICGATVSNLLLIGVMGIMWWWMDGKLADQREDVAHGLVFGHHSLPGKERDALATLFTVTNNSSLAVSGKRQLVCYVISAVGNGGTSVQQNLWQAFMPDPVTRKPEGVVGFGNPERLWDDVKIGPLLEANGDTETYDQCLSIIHFQTDTDCVDLKLIFLYSLETQPALKQRKDIRFVGTVQGGQFAWQAEPVESRAKFCRDYYPKDRRVPDTGEPW
jgi:hypothetical protein